MAHRVYVSYEILVINDSKFLHRIKLGNITSYQANLSAIFIGVLLSSCYQDKFRKPSYFSQTKKTTLMCSSILTNIITSAIISWCQVMTMFDLIYQSRSYVGQSCFAFVASPFQAMPTQCKDKVTMRPYITFLSLLDFSLFLRVDQQYSTFREFLISHEI